MHDTTNRPCGNREKRFFALFVVRSPSPYYSYSSRSHIDDKRMCCTSCSNRFLCFPLGFTSCHVFMVDSRLVAHEGHAARAHAFRFQCTADAAGDGRACLEFPPTAEPILQVGFNLLTPKKKSPSLLPPPFPPFISRVAVVFLFLLCGAKLISIKRRELLRIFISALAFRSFLFFFVLFYFIFLPFPQFFLMTSSCRRCSLYAPLRAVTVTTRLVLV